MGAVGAIAARTLAKIHSGMSVLLAQHLFRRSHVAEAGHLYFISRVFVLFSLFFLPLTPSACLLHVSFFSIFFHWVFSFSFISGMSIM